MNAPDRSGPNLDLLANSALDASPAFPFSICPVNGYFELDPPVAYTPATAATEVVYTQLPGGARGVVYPTNEIILAVVGTTSGIMVTNWRIMYLPDDWVTGDHADYIDFDPLPVYNENTKYIFKFSAADKDNFTVTVMEESGQAVTSATLTKTDLFSGNPTIYVGYPTDNQLANNGTTGGPQHPFIGAFGVTVNEVRVENPGPTDIAVSPAVSKTTAEVGYWVGSLSATHTRSAALPCTFALVTGTGDTDNASFSIRGSQVHVAGTLTVGAKSIRVQAMDRYGATYEKALTITVS
jgi:hypothetical protein